MKGEPTVLHVILGDGEMTKRELSASLEDLLETNGDDPFWFLIHAKPEPTQTDTSLMAWIHEREVYYQVVGSDIKGADAIYEGFQEKYEIKNLGPKIVDIMTNVPDEGEDADLLALFVSDEADAEEDRWLYGVIEKVLAAGFKVKALNDGMTEIGLEEGEETEEAEEAPEPPKPAAKKAAAKTRPLAAVPDPPADEELSREALEAMDLEDVKAYAAKKGLVLKD